MNGFLRRKQAKMDAILSAAFELFRENGIEAVKLTDIAKKSDVSKVSIYNYFGNKEELVKQVVFDYMDKKAITFKEIMMSSMSFKEKFQTMYAEKMISADELTDGLTDGGLLSNKLLESPQVQNFLNTYAQTKIKPLFIGFIEQGKREGEIDADISTGTILMYIQALHGILSSSITMKQRLDLGKLYFYGFKGK